MFMAAILNQEVVTMTTPTRPEGENIINCSNDLNNCISDHPNADKFLSSSSADDKEDQDHQNQSDFSSRLLHTRLFFRRRSISLTSVQDLASSGFTLSESKESLSASAMASSRPPRKTTVDNTNDVRLRKKIRDRDATPLAQDRDRQSISSMIFHDPPDYNQLSDQMNETVKSFEMIKSNNNNHQKSGGSNNQVNRNDSGYNTDVGKRTPTPIRHIASQKFYKSPVSGKK